VPTIIHFTRCPQCRTTFRITSQQLELREGRARCGHCRAVFNAFAALVNFKGERVPAPGMEPVLRETMTLRDSVAAPESDFTAMPPSTLPSFAPSSPPPSSPPPSSLPSPPPSPAPSLPPSPAPSEVKAKKTTLPPTPEIKAPDDIPSTPVAQRRKGPPSIEEIALAIEEASEEKRQRRKELGLAMEETTEEKRQHRKEPRKEKPSPLALVLNPAKKPTIWQRLHLPPWCRPLFYLISLPGLAALLAAQAVFFQHDELASAHPKLTPALSQGCRWLQCEIKPLQNLDALTIEASDVQFDPYDAQQLLLAVTLRNRSNKPVAYPRLSLELTDAQGRLLARHLFAPDAYLVRASDAAIGAPAARDHALRLLLRSDFAASGYKLSLVY
jgi:predicted Zn finger-like uncharacterized protein/SLAP domain-containing protein